MSVSYAPEAWPEHSEDLETIIVGQSVVKLYGHAPNFTFSPEELSEISKLVESHPMNSNHVLFGTEKCASLIKSLLQEDAESFSMLRFKVELLRQIQLYVERGLKVLRDQPTIEPEPPQKPPKRARSQSLEEPDSSSKKQKVEEETAIETSVQDEPPDKEPEPTEPESQTASLESEKPGENVSPEPENEAPEEKPEDEDNQSDSESERVELQKQREAQQAQQAQEQQEKVSRRRTRTRRSARSTPEPEVESKPSPKAQKEEDSKEESPEQESEEENEESRPNSESEDSDEEEEEGEEGEDEPKTEDESPRPKRKRSVTFDEDEQPRLADFVSSLMSHKTLSFFKETDFHEDPIILSPTCLQAIHEEIQENNLGSIEDVQIELLKMVANGVVAEEVDRKQSKNAISAIDSAVNQYREDSASNSKRRRK